MIIHYFGRDMVVRLDDNTNTLKALNGTVIATGKDADDYIKNNHLECMPCGEHPNACPCGDGACDYYKP